MPSEFNALHARLERLEQDNAQMKTQFHTAQRRLRIQASLAFVAFLLAVFALPANRQAIAQGYGVTLASLNTRLTAVEAKTQFQSANATTKTTTFSACNVIVNNGLGAINGNPASNPDRSQAHVNGLGNLIIGYNELRSRYNYGPDIRTGSHNLIIGDQNDYSSYGGVVVGRFNTISAPYASVSGGDNSTASGDFASVSGGVSNMASSSSASVSGGTFNTASGYYASVSGGTFNTASGYAASVSGGSSNTASGNYSSASGGYFNTASGIVASVSGGGSGFIFGPGVTQSNDFGWAAGGTGAGTYHSP